jgi:hypothetical protein
MSKTTEDANLSEEDLRAIVREGGARLDRMLGNMQAYNANINGSNAYLHQWRNKLVALMKQEEMSSIWFSVSMADNHWQDLARALDPPGDEPRVFASEADAAKFRRKMVRDSPHLVDAFFMHRVKAMLKTFFGKDGFEAAWHFVRLELQKRGVFMRTAASVSNAILASTDSHSKSMPVVKPNAPQGTPVSSSKITRNSQKSTLPMTNGSISKIRKTMLTKWKWNGVRARLLKQKRRFEREWKQKRRSLRSKHSCSPRCIPTHQATPDPTTATKVPFSFQARTSNIRPGKTGDWPRKKLAVPF